MKLKDLMEASYSGRRRWRHHGAESFGLRVEVSKDERAEIVNRLSAVFRDKEAKEGDRIGTHPIVWTSPENASTFPASIRLVIRKNDIRSDRQELPGQLMVKALMAAIKRVFKEVLGVEVSVALESDEDANGLRYIDTKVSWLGRYAT